MPVYTRSQFYTDLRRDAASIENIDDIVNRAVRDVIGEVDLRSTKRRAYLSPPLNEDQWDYKAPADLKDNAIVDIRMVGDRNYYDGHRHGRYAHNRFRLVTPEYFDKYRSSNHSLVTLDERDFLNKVRIASWDNLDDHQVTLHEMDSITENGTWTVSLDASNLTLDEDNFIDGVGSLNFDMDIAGTTTVAGILQNSTMDEIDLTGYENGSIFVWVYIANVSGGLDSFTLRIGNSASVYYSKTVTSTNESLAFEIGWNLLRFDLASATETGTVDLETIDYLYISVDRGAVGSLNSTDWRIDYIVARRGVPHELIYYTKYGWQTTAGVYIENSTATTDYINCDTSEYELFILKGKELIAQDLEFDEEEKFTQKYLAKKTRYENANPSDRMLMQMNYFNFGHDFSDLNW